MRRHALVLSTVLAMGVAAPALAQVGSKTTVAVRELTADAPRNVQAELPEVLATPDTVVARLMSFDANHDGRLVRTELPERMQGLFTRADTSRDGALDASEVRHLAYSPPGDVSVRGFQPGHYGFGEDSFGGFDSKLHIEGAIDDLRLASDTREKALGIGRHFIETVNAQARAELLGVAERVLTSDQLTDFKEWVDPPQVNALVPVNVASLTSQARVQLVQQLRARAMLVADHGNLAVVAAKYPLSPEQQQTLQTAIERFQAHDHLSDAERAALVAQLHVLLTNQERDDLTAALERPTIVKQDSQLSAQTRVETLSGAAK
jgi:hypothetical protein